MAPLERNHSPRGRDVSPADDVDRHPAHDARQAARQAYPFQQRYAPVHEGMSPTAEQFQAVELCDVSAQGVALLLDAWPHFERLVVELGVGANVSQQWARVVRIQEVLDGGRRRYRVGCELERPHNAGRSGV